MSSPSPPAFSLNRLGQWIRRGLEHGLDLALPPLCLNCDAPVGGNQMLCPDCWKDIHFIAPPFCACCGAPFEVPVDADTLCGTCIAHPPIFAAARSAMTYSDASKGLLLRFKHGDRTHPAPAMAAWMRKAGESFWPDTDVLIPVPLHRWRLLRRRYNQSALLAQALGRLTNLPVFVDGLQRIRATPKQGHLNREQRKKNVAGALRLNPRHAPFIADKRVVLIDDVLTTGATANECSRILTEAGAKNVRVVTLAKTRSFLS